MSQNELLSLRERILKDITPLVLEIADEGEARFSLLLRIIQAGNASSVMYEKAYENAKAIENKNEQLNALMSLLDEVDFDAQSGASSGNEQPPAPIDERSVRSDTVPQQLPTDTQY